MDSELQVKQRVRDRYGARARDASASCCSIDSATSAMPGIYNSTQIKALPLETVAASAGCGNPTALAGLRTGEKVVDLGSGGGIDCFLAAQQVGPTGLVVGVDMTTDMVRLATRNAKVMKLNNVVFLLGEMERLPLAPDLADVVISNCVICLSTDKDELFRDAFRVLKPGGRMHISDMLLEHGELPQEIKNDPERWVSCIGGAEAKDDYLSRITAAGFENPAVTESTPAGFSSGELSSNLISAKVVAYKPMTA